MSLLDINVFAGAGGMAVGLRAAGFAPALLYEVDKHACTTLRDNRVAVDSPMPEGVREADIRKIEWEEVRDLRVPVRLLAGGVPCQPFSLGGKHLADKDGRNLFPEFIGAVKALRPQAVLIENVRGLLRQSFQPYFDYILRRLESPSLVPRPSELWESHNQRLRRYQAAAGYEPEYLVQWRMHDAADFGVPQNRCRVFIVATRYDLAIPYRFPERTHSRGALLQAQASGEYWDRHKVARSRRSPVPDTRDEDTLPARPWTTVRDALSGLPTPAPREDESHLNHWRIPGARAYKGHTGSCLDWPSKTIKAGVHGVPGGENTVMNGSGKVRYYTLREAARIQSFPDTHVFAGARLHVTRQIGNAVPSVLASAIARPLWKLLLNLDLGANKRGNHHA